MKKLDPDSFRVRWLQLVKQVPKGWTVYELDEAERRKYLAFYFDVPMSSGYGLREEISSWITETIGENFMSVEGNVSATQWYFCFKKESDATLLKMRW
jgi:hypothetical protein